VRVPLCALASGLIFVLVWPALAQNQDTTAALVLTCDRAAASPTDKERPPLSGAGCDRPTNGVASASHAGPEQT
jgi:hypothetical protein